jgi:hypothetical protein
MSPRLARLDRNVALFREVNEHIAELANPDLGDHFQIVCECANTGCQVKLTISIEDFRRVRHDAGRFIVVPGHTVPAVEDVVESGERYEIVAKHDTIPEDIVPVLAAP